jgi:hypothetical protein
MRTQDDKKHNTVFRDTGFMSRAFACLCLEISNSFIIKKPIHSEYTLGFTVG